MMKIKIKELEELCIKALTQRGLLTESAKLVFDEYLDAELRGRYCHGFQAFKRFGAKLAAPTGEPRIIKETDSYLHIDGQENLGQVVCHKFVPKLIKKAKRSGIAMMGIKNMHSYLMPGTYARKAAESDLIGLIFNYGGRGRIAPTGSIDPILGTNPIAIGIPSENYPIVIDMATSKTSMLDVTLAAKLGINLELGIAIDKSGHETTDPNEAVEGALLPFGGYKGSALALAIEIMTRTMFGVEPCSIRGFLFIFIDPSVFQPIEKFKKDVSKLTEEIKSSRKEEGVKEVLIPGEHSEKIKEENLKKDCIELDEKILEEIKSLL